MGEAGADGEATTVIRIAEAEIGAALGRQLQTLLQECLPGYPGRGYFKLPPHFRYLAVSADGGVAAQMGVEFRVIRVGDAVVRTFGIVDLCVRESQRSRGLAGRLLADVTAHARSCGMAFIVLFADDDRLYTRNGWARVTNRCSWVRIDEHVTLGLARHEDTGAMMVKALGEQGSRHLPRRSSVSTPAAPVRRPAGGQMSVLRHHLRTALRRHPRTPASPSHKGGPQPRLADAGPQRGGAPLDAADDPSGIRAWSAWRRAP